MNYGASLKSSGSGETLDDAKRLTDAAARLSERLNRVSESAPNPSLSAAIDEILARQKALEAEWPSRSNISGDINLDNLETHVRRLTGQINQIRKPGSLDQALARLSRELSGIHGTLAEAAPRRDLDLIETELHALADRLEAARRKGLDRGSLTLIERGLAEIHDALRDMRPAEAIEALNANLGVLTRRIAELQQKSADHAGVLQVADAVRELRGMTMRVASAEALARLEKDVASLSAKLDRIGVPGPAASVAMEAVESRIAAIASAMELRLSQPPQFPQLDPLIQRLTQSLDQSDARLQELSRVERALQASLKEIAVIRERGGANRPDSGVQALKDDLDRVRELQAQNDRRTQEALNGVHQTLERVLKRLSMIDPEGRTAAPRPISREPAPPLAPLYERRASDRKPDQLIEPGSGAPVREAAEPPHDRSDFIAAARRAAQAAMAEPVPILRIESDHAAPHQKESTRFDAWVETGRRPSMVGLAALLLVGTALYVLMGESLRERLASVTASRPALTDKVQDVQVQTPEKSAALPSSQETAPPKPDITGSTTTFIAPPPAPLDLFLPKAPDVSRPDAGIEPALRKAALEGDPAAAYEIAMRYSEGQNVPQNLEEAALWLERAANSGLAPAQYRLASMFEKGQGVRKNLDSAHKLYRAAAEKGNGKAMHNLAVLYAEGFAGQPDYPAALKWFSRAAGHGIADSQYNLGVLYGQGIGVRHDLTQAYKWFALAAQQGDPEAGKKRDEVGAKLDAPTIEAARAAVRAFTPELQPDEAINVRRPSDRPAGLKQRSGSPIIPKKSASM